MTKRKRQEDKVVVMLAVSALNKIKLEDADYTQLADDLNISLGRIKSVVKKMHPYVKINEASSDIVIQSSVLSHELAPPQIGTKKSVVSSSTNSRKFQPYVICALLQKRNK